MEYSIRYNNPLCIWSKDSIFFLFPMLFDPTLKGKPSESTSFSTPFRAGSRRKASKCTTGYTTVNISICPYIWSYSNELGVKPIEACVSKITSDFQTGIKKITFVKIDD